MNSTLRQLSLAPALEARRFRRSNENSTVPNPTFLQGTKVLVVGAGGFLGFPLAEQVANLGASVVALSRNRSVAEQPGIRWMRGDVADRTYAERLVSRVRPSVVFHLTSSSRGGRELPTVGETVRNDLVATVNMLSAAVRAGVDRFVMTGSLEEPRETDTAPVSPYAAAKWAATGYGRMFRLLYGLDVRIVRPMMTFGPGQKTFKLVPSTILGLMRNEQVTINSGARLVDWVYRDDVVRGLVQAACVPTLPQPVDLGTGCLTSVGQMALEISRQLNKESLLSFGSATRGEEIVYRADVLSARRFLNFEAVTTLSDGISRSINYYANFNEA